MYFVWEVSMTNPFWTEIDITNIQEYRDNGWQPAMVFPDNLPDEPPPLKVRVISRKRPADMIMYGLQCVVSERLRDVLDQFKVQARYFPTEVTWKKAPYTDAKFFLMKLHDNLDALDTAKSDYDVWDRGGTILPYIHMRRVVLRDDVVEGYHFFSLAKCLDQILIASEELVNAVKAAGLTGMTILTLEKWSDYATNGIPADEVV